MVFLYDRYKEVTRTVSGTNAGKQQHGPGDSHGDRANQVVNQTRIELFMKRRQRPGAFRGSR